MNRKEFGHWLVLHLHVFPDVNGWLESFADAQPGDPTTDGIVAVWANTFAGVEYVDAIAATERMSKDLTLRPHTPQDTAAFVLTVASSTRHKRLAADRDATYQQSRLLGAGPKPEDFYGHLDWAFTRSGKPRLLRCFRCKDRGQLHLYYTKNGTPRNGIAACVCARGDEEKKRNAPHMEQYREGTDGVEAFDVFGNPYDGSTPAVIT